MSSRSETSSLCVISLKFSLKSCDVFPAGLTRSLMPGEAYMCRHTGQSLKLVYDSDQFIYIGQ